MNPSLTKSWRRVTALLVLISLLHTPMMVPTAAAEDSTILRISKSTIYGGLLGLLLGSAVAIVVEDNRDEPIRWGLVMGVFGGFAYGVYSASTGREDFFHDSADLGEPSRFLLPQGRTVVPATQVATPLRPDGNGRQEFSPFVTSATE